MSIDIMRQHVPLATIGALVIICTTIWGMRNNISTRVESIEKSQVTKEDIRQIVKDNNIELLTLIDTKIALAVQKKN